MSRRNRLALLTFTILSGFFVAFVYHFVILGEMLRLPYPYNTWLFRPDDRFMDFGNGWLFGHGPYQPLPHHGPFPFLFFLCSVFHVMPMRVSLLVFLMAGLIVTWWYCADELFESSWLQCISDATPFVLFSYPMLSALERANFDLWILGSLIFFDRNFRRGNFLRSALWLASAIAIKPFAVVYLVLFAAKRKWQMIAVTLLFAVALTLGSLCTFVGGFAHNLQQWTSNLRSYQDTYALGYEGAVNSCSLFSMVKWGYFMLDPKVFFGNSLEAWAQPYFWSCVAIFLATTLYVVFQEHEYYRQFLLLTVTAVMLPFCSGDYRLIYLLIPLMQFIKSPISRRSDLAIAVLFGLLLIPKHWVRVHGSEISSSALISPLLLMMLWVTIVGDGLFRSGGANEFTFDRLRRLGRPLSIEAATPR